LTGREHLHRGFVRVQHGAGQHFGAQGIDQGLQLHAALPHPLRQRRARNRHACTRKDVLLARQRQMIGVLGHQHMGQQARGRYAFIDHVRGNWRLH
jgi:hypothetical protein